MEHAYSWGPAGVGQGPEPALSSYFEGITVICQLAARFTASGWDSQTPCPEWRARDLAGHLRCIADDYHEYLDDAPSSRYARLLRTGPAPQTLARKVSRQNAAELAALADAPPGRAHRGLRPVRPCLRAAAALGLGAAASLLPRPGGDRGRDGGRGLR